MREAHVGIIREPAYLLLLLPRTDVKKVKFKTKVKVEKRDLNDQSEDSLVMQWKSPNSNLKGFIHAAHRYIKRNWSKRQNNFSQEIKKMQL
jgi:hypothetical protein